MANNLVIVESPAKAKTINKILGNDYVVKASMGHVRDLPVDSLGVAIDKGFEPDYVQVKGKARVVAELRKIVKGIDTVYLATDPDREGEAIAWHLKELLSPSARKSRFMRVQYNEITPAAVRRAFENPCQIDQNRVDAQQARRVLDRIVGYRVSPVLWQRVRRGLSAGRVQSVALRLVCEREDAVRKFVPEAYWLIGAKVRKFVDPRDPFALRLIRIANGKADVKTEEAAAAVRADLEGRTLQVASIHTREVNRRPLPPFITSTLQQAASSAFGLSPSRTMGIAQKLYEGVDLGDGPVGLITYMRTDSVSVAAEAQARCREYVAAKFGAEFIPAQPNVYRSRESAQGAHEAIRPTDVSRTPEQLSHVLNPLERKVYELVWRRFVASQMAPARFSLRIVKVDALPRAEGDRPFLFQATASDVVFPGYMKAGVPDTRQLEKRGEEGEGEQDQVQPLPPLCEGEKLDLIEWLSERKETKPPSRYSEASLVKALEQNGIGRPSTYAQILATLDNRGYVTVEKRSLRPTELGENVNRLLVGLLDQLFNVSFTAGMEAELDKIEEGKVPWAAMMQAFYEKFQEWMVAARAPAAENASVQRVLEAFSQVKEWAEPHKRGRRTYDDRVFVESIREQLSGGQKPVTERQLDALVKTACRYRAQITGLDDLLKGIGQEEALADARNAMAPETARRRFEILAGLDMDERTANFVGSVKRQADSGRSLSPAQAGALDRIIMRFAAKIPDFEKVRAELGLAAPVVDESDKEVAPLIEHLRSVKEWKPAVQRGKRTFDDKAFFESLAGQFAAKGTLSQKQRAALRKLGSRYGAGGAEQAAKGPDAQRQE
jgi:DNA topoisomerase-1